MKKKLISIMLVLVMTTVTAACGMGKPGSADYNPLEVDFSEKPTTITYLTIGDKPTNGETEDVIEQINKILLKKVNATLDIYYVTWDDYLNRYNKVLSDGDIDVDLVGTGTDWLDAWPNVIKGNFLPMSKEMLRSFCPRTYENVTDDQWSKCSYNGEIYFIPENEYTQWTNHGFIYREDLAEEAGLNGINSWEDLTRYLKYLSDNKADIIPWDADGTNYIIGLGYLMSKSRYNPIYEMSTYGLWGAESNDLQKIICPYYEGGDFIEFAKLMNDWNRYGVWRDGQNGAGDNTEEFYEGYSGLIQHHTQKYFTEIEPDMEIKMPSANTGFYWFGKESANLMRTSILHGAMAIHAKSKNPEKALMVYDVLRNDKECYQLFRYGKKGVQYDINDSMRMEKPSGYNTERDSIVTNFWWGRRDEYEFQDEDYAWDEYYKLIDYYDHVAVDYPWDGYNFLNDIDHDKLAAVIAVCDEYIPKITYARYSIPAEEEVLIFREKLREAGVEELTRQIQKTVDSY